MHSLFFRFAFLSVISVRKQNVIIISLFHNLFYRDFFYIIVAFCASVQFCLNFFFHLHDVTLIQRFILSRDKRSNNFCIELYLQVFDALCKNHEFNISEVNIFETALFKSIGSFAAYSKWNSNSFRIVPVYY